MTDKEKIREDLERLQTNINECLDDLAIARDRKDDGEELIALRRMESLLVDAKQTCTSVLNSLKEEPVSDDLEEAANDYDNHCGVLYVEDEDGDYVETLTAIQNAFKAGANWHKDQMMKGAVEAKASASLAKELGVKAGVK